MYIIYTLQDFKIIYKIFLIVTNLIQLKKKIIKLCEKHFLHKCIIKLFLE